MQLFSADAKMFLKMFLDFCLPTKSLKNHPQKLLRKTQIHFFSLLPAQPKWPKKKNSCSEMWPKDQLYMELGLRSWQNQIKFRTLRYCKTRCNRHFELSNGQKASFYPIYWPLKAENCCLLSLTDPNTNKYVKN